ncbi:MAG: SPOR domain-containing protein [Pseudomonadota bacterium]|nr:SPOR domain-containing protein [Pseudomonadota bacterium]
MLQGYPQLTDAVYTKGERGGDPWFMVFSGQYPTKAAARQGADRLPEPLRKNSPWVREIKDL